MRCTVLVGVVATLLNPWLHAEQLQTETIAAFDGYVELSEQRMKAEEQTGSFLRVSAKEREATLARLEEGKVTVDRIATLDHGRAIGVPGGMIHHWIGTAFIPGVTLAPTVAFLQDYDSQYKYYAPDVERSRLVARDGKDFKVCLRLRMKKIVTAVLDTEYDVSYRSLSPDRAAAQSVSTRIAEVENAGHKNESEKPVGNDSGYLWRLNSYWRFGQRDGGTYVQLEAISLTRDIPTGLGWLIGPFLSSIPRESLEFTLGRTRKALLRGAKPLK